MRCTKSSNRDHNAAYVTPEEPKKTKGSVNVNNPSTGRSENRRVTPANEYNHLVNKTVQHANAVVGRDQAHNEKVKLRESAEEHRTKATQASDKQEAIVRKMLQTKTADEIAKDPKVSRMSHAAAQNFISIAKRLEAEQS